MIQSTQEVEAPSAIEPLTRSIPVKVETDDEGSPTAVRLGRWVDVVAVQDCWSIDDEWWNVRSMSRTYYKVALQNGFELTICKDLDTGNWYQQNYS